MFIVSQSGKEVAQLNLAWIVTRGTTMYDIMHQAIGDDGTSRFATYDSMDEAQSHFNLMIYWLRKGEPVYDFPQPRQTPSEPSNP